MTQPKYPELVDVTDERRKAAIDISEDTYKEYLNGQS